MEHTNLPDAEEYAKKQRNKRRWYKLVICLAAVVVFCTTYALILPAITMEKECQMEEHLHTAACYDQAEDGTEVLLCQLQEHVHDASCDGETEETVDLPEDDIVGAVGTVFATQTTAGADGAAPISVVSDPATGTEPTGDDPDAGALPEGIDQQPYELPSKQIESIRLYYRAVGSKEWKELGAESGSEQIPGDADFKLYVDYINVPVAEIIDAGYIMTYQVPEGLREVRFDGEPILWDSNEQKVGELSLDGNTVKVAFDKTWISKQSTTDTLKGSFFVLAKADLSKFPDGGGKDLVFGDTHITVNFEADLLAKYGDVELEKTLGTLSEEEDGDYLSYTLQVTAGKDGMPGVVVKDRIADHPDNIAGYVFSPDDAVDLDADGKGFSWYAGDLAADETRTLTYKVKLRDGYTGGHVPGNADVTNKAGVYTKLKDESLFLRQEDSETFKPQAGATLSKVAAKYAADPVNGGGTVQYTIWVKAYETNSYTLDDVTVRDSLDGSVGGYNNPTDSKYRPYLEYEKDSFYLYAGGQDRQNGSEGLTPITSDKEPELTDTDKDGKMNDSFCWNIGSLKPGEAKTMTYTVRVDAGAFIAAGTQDLIIKNRAAIYSDETSARNDSNRFNAFSTTTNVGRKAWLRKMLDEKTNAEIQVPIPTGDAVYDLTSGSLQQMGTSGSFTVPEGSFPYHVVVNEAGDWNLTKTLMKDQLSPAEYMAYTGYVKVSAYKVDQHADASTDQAALDMLQKKTPEKTAWVKVDGLSAFQFTPEALGINGTYAYLLTYYAEPKNLEQITATSVQNSFTLEETVVWGSGSGGSYEIKSISAGTSVTVEGSNYFKAEKEFWYYDRSEEGSPRGELYWGLKAEGNLIEAGTQFKDSCQYDEKNNPHKLKSAVGAYIIKGAGEMDLTSRFKDLSALEKSTDVKKLAASAYEVTQQAESEIIFALREDVVLGENEYLYFIVTSEPTSLPNKKWEWKDYSNTLFTLDKAAGAAWVEQNEAEYRYCSGEKLLKAGGGVIKAVPNEEGKITEACITKLAEPDNANYGDTVYQYDELTKAGGGIYASWLVRINQGSTLEAGDYRIVEQIPQGMEVVYIQRYSTRYNLPVFKEISGLTKDWAEVRKNYTNDKNATEAIYYVNGQQVMWETGEIRSNRDEPGSWYVEFLVVCKVTDEDVLLGGAEKLFQNAVELRKGDELLDTAGHGVTIKTSNLSKAGTHENKSSNYTFTLTINETGCDLVQGSDTVVLVDEMCQYLIPDPESITVVHSITGEAVTGWKSSIEGQTLKLTLPDNLPLTITYRAAINAKPGEAVSISNHAYWYGYTSEGGSSVTQEDVSYEAAGTVDTASTPSVKVVKMDQYDNQTYLAGAEFSFIPGSFDTQGRFQTQAGVLAVRGTTDENGIVQFKTGTEYTLAYNTIYRLMEIKAPEGYVIDQTPHYFAVAKDTKDSTAAYEALEAEVQRLRALDVNVSVLYTGSEYVYRAYNHKGEVAVTKAFQDAAGDSIGIVSGRYAFGIYDAPLSSHTEETRPLQTIQLLFGKDGTNQTEKFTNLELGKTYYVYELDEAGRPIPDQTAATIDGKPFHVMYETTEGITVSATASSQAVTITNRMNYGSLPATGKSGIIWYIAGGLLLTITAASLLCRHKKA